MLNYNDGPINGVQPPYNDFQAPYNGGQPLHNGVQATYNGVQPLYNGVGPPSGFPNLDPKYYEYNFFFHNPPLNIQRRSCTTPDFQGTTTGRRP